MYLITVFLFVNFNDNKKKIPKNGKKKEKIYNQIDTFNNIANT